MSDVGPEGRSFESVARADLRRLASLAKGDREDYFERYPQWDRLYRTRVLCSALCQGAALFAATGETGINDFDIYTFYAKHPDRRWYAKRRAITDFGDAKFGQTVDRPQFTGRRVDLMGRALSVSPSADPVRALQAYLADDGAKSARLLSEKAVVLLEPARCLGWLIWLKGKPVLRKL